MLTADSWVVGSGKVRDWMELPDDTNRLLMIASDRISAFDVVLPTDIPDKGRVLTALSRFWFEQTADLMPNHLLDSRLSTVLGVFEAALDDLRQRGLNEAAPSGIGSF